MVIFNYDRCVEHFLINSIQTYYGIDATEAARLVDRIEIYHPYGKVGHLPWQQDDKSINFGTEPNPGDLIRLSEQIRTFTEGTDPSSSEISSIREHVKYSKMVLFLGFAFHRLNLDLLMPDSDGNLKEARRASCFATAKGISNNDCNMIKGELEKLKPMNVYLRNDLACDELFTEFWRSLSYA